MQCVRRRRGYFFHFSIFHRHVGVHAITTNVQRR